jgi:hypothetical protein
MNELLQVHDLRNGCAALLRLATLAKLADAGRRRRRSPSTAR